MSVTETLDVRSRILQEATRLFANHGYDGTSIEQIAQAVGIKRPTLVYHFGSKPELRDQVLAAVLGRWREDLPRLLSAATTGSDRFRSGFLALVSFFRADPHRARLLIREQLDRPAEMAELFRVHLQPLTQLVTDYLRQGQVEGRIRTAVDPEAYVVQLISTVIASTAGTGVVHLVRDPPDEERQLAELFRIVRTSLFNERQIPPIAGPIAEQ